jgi:hypothetical protein
MDTSSYVAVVIALAAAAGVQELRVQGLKTQVVEARAETGRVLLDVETAGNSAAAAIRTLEQQTADKIEKESADGQARIDTAQRDAAAARTAADSLRTDLAHYRRAATRTTAHPGAAAVGASAGDAIDLLSDLFTRADARAGELAAAADRAHAAGTTCERAYDALRTPQP